ncbi:MAG: rhomboid family intramembrane serine protease [Bacteroidota bacterium]|jgi:membrane associated rhomboid family serine protease
MTQFRPSRFEILPVIVKNLLIINGLFFLAKFAFSGPDALIDLEETFALHAWQSSLFRPWQLITHMFLHGDFAHIFGNMFALWMFGSVLENVWGSKKFLTFYLVCGLGAALMHLLFLSYEFLPMMKAYQQMYMRQAEGGIVPIEEMRQFMITHLSGNPEHLRQLQNMGDDPAISRQLFGLLTDKYQESLNMATVGASGAVFGVLAAFVYLFPNTYIYIYFLIPIKAKWLGILYFTYELFFAIQNSAGDNVARWAHVGGAIVGLLIVFTWNKKNRQHFY